MTLNFIWYTYSIRIVIVLNLRLKFIISKKRKRMSSRGGRKMKSIYARVKKYADPIPIPIMIHGDKLSV